MKVEFDPAKDAANRTKHGVSLQAAAGFDWDTALEREDDRFDYGETRFVAIGLIGARLYVMVFTQGTDDDAVRIISLRPAEKHETRFYHDQI
ncbi:MAG: BrnT family toxin [Alteraurantiacibacter sp.]